MEDTPNAEQDAVRQRSLKLIAIAVAVVLLISAGFGAWYFFPRHWSIEDMAAAVINDPTPGAPGFKHSLAGKSVVVEGKVTNITTRSTSLGDLSFVELDHFPDFTLTVWGVPTYDIGDRIEMRVQFEWSICNEEEHVFSPQLSFPNLLAMMSVEIVIRAVNAVSAGAGLVTSQLENGDVRLDVIFVMDPISLGSANCTLKAGTHSWAVEYMDIMGEYETTGMTDHMTSLNNAQGTSGVIRFEDANADAYLDEGDYFLLKNLTRPSSESGMRTYLFTIDWPADPDWNTQSRGHAVAYLPVTSKGLLRYDHGDAPYARLVMSKITSGIQYTVTSVDFAPAWGNVSVMIQADYISGFGFFNRMEWNVTAAELTGPPGTTRQFEAVSLGVESIRLNITDAQGNGFLDKSDSVSITSAGVPFSKNSTFSIFLMFKPTTTSIWTADYDPNATPTVRTSSEAVSTGLRCLFNAPHTGFNLTYEPYDVPWREIAVGLSDGNETVNWTFSSSDLNSGTAESVSLPLSALGSLTVCCNASDIEGNGYVDRGDTISITTAGTERFSSGVNYTISVFYKPAMSEMCNMTFHG